jgi:hypothetical protein
MFKLFVSLLLLMLSHGSLALSSNINAHQIDIEPKICSMAELIIPDVVGSPVEMIKGEFCYDARQTTLVSQNCQNDCMLKKMAENFFGEIEYSGRGTPGALLCLALNGESVGVYFLHNGVKNIYHICKINDEIISSDYLTIFARGNKDTQKTQHTSEYVHSYINTPAFYFLCWIVALLSILTLTQLLIVNRYRSTLFHPTPLI